MNTAITLGSKTTTGGEVISASSGSSINNKGIACIGDKATCTCGAKNCKGIGPIVAMGPRPTTLNGIQWAKAGDFVDTGCGTCFLSNSEHNVMISSDAGNVKFGDGISFGNNITIDSFHAHQALMASKKSIINEQKTSITNKSTSTSNTNNNATTGNNQQQEKPQKEYIAIAGGQYDDSSNKMMFIAQAIRYLRKTKLGNDIHSLLLVTAGYTEGQILLAEKSCEKFKFKLVKVQDMTSITNYINSRKKSSIEKLMIFSHGIPFNIELGYKLGSNNKNISELSLNSDNFKKIYPTIFSKNAIIESYACRTGIGNVSDIDLNKILDLLLEKVPGNTDIIDNFPKILKEKYSSYKIEDAIQFKLMLDKSLAQDMANYFNIPVQAFITRSNYDKTWGSMFDRHVLKQMCDRDIQDENWCDNFEKKNEERHRLKNDKKYNTVYNIDGASHDVYASMLSTPITTKMLASKKMVFRPQ